MVKQNLKGNTNKPSKPISEINESKLNDDWEVLLQKLSKMFGKRLDLNGVLFLIGIQELGKGTQHYSKEEKQDLMHIAICKVMSLSGYYVLEGIDDDGWPHWVPTKKLPFLKIHSQEELLKLHVLEYFNEEIGW